MGRPKETKNLKDTRGRTLHDGERQKADGRYEYRYTDETGKSRSVYSWRLLASDKTPAGKKDSPPLRQLERDIIRDQESGISSLGSDITVYQLCLQYTSSRRDVKHNTRAGYGTVLKFLEEDLFGKRSIASVKTSEAKAFFQHLQEDHHKGFSSVRCFRGVLHQAFKTALEDDLIRKNPFDFELRKWVQGESKRREALDPKDEKRWLKFLKYDEHFSEIYLPAYILFNTGLRVSELCGLTLDDIDLDRKVIYVTKQLQRDRSGVLYIEDPDTEETSTKTEAGMRIVPMRQHVYEAFKEVIESREAPEVEPVVDGYSGFLFLNYKARKGLRPMVAMDLEHHFHHAREKFNKIYKEPMPKLTPHTGRLTFCTKMVRQMMEPTRLQLIMGHSNINITLGYYTHTRVVDAQASMAEVDSKLMEEDEDFF